MSFAWGARERDAAYHAKEAGRTARQLFRRACALCDTAPTTSQPSEAYTTAHQLLSDALDLRPASGACFLCRGICRLALGRLPDAADDLRMASTVSPERIAAQGYLGLVLFEMKRYKDAIDSITKCVTVAAPLPPTSAPTSVTDAACAPGPLLPASILHLFLSTRGCCHLHLHDWASADSDFTSALAPALAPAPAAAAAARLRRGRARLARGMTSGAISDLRSAAEALPTHSPAWSWLGLALEASDAAGAVEAYQKAVDTHGVDGTENSYENDAPWLLSELLSSLGKALAVVGRHSEALSAFDVAVELDSRSVSTLLARSAAWSVMGNTARALADAQRARDYAPDSCAAMLTLGTVLASLRRFDEAASVLRASINLATKSANREYWASSLVAFTTVAVVLNKHHDALDLLASAIGHAGSEYRLRLLRGQVLCGVYLFNEAVADLTRASELEDVLEPVAEVVAIPVEIGDVGSVVPHTALLWRAKAYMNLGNLEAAKDDIQTLISVSEWAEEPEPLAVAAQIALEGNQLMECIHYATSCLARIQNNAAKLHSTQEQIQRKIDRLVTANSAANDTFEYHQLVGIGDQLKSLAAKTAAVRVTRARAHAALQRCNSAARDLSVAAELAPTPQNMVMLASALLRCRRPVRALHTARAVLELHPTERAASRAHYVAGVALQYLGRDMEAEQELTQAIAAQPAGMMVPELVHERAKVRQQIGDHAGAISDFTAVLRQQSNNARALYRLSFSLYAVGAVLDAKTAMKSASDLNPSEPLFANDTSLLTSGVPWIELIPPGNEDVLEVNEN